MGDVRGVQARDRQKQEMAFAKAVADRVIFLENGKIVEEGSPTEFFDNPKTDRLKRFLETFSYEK